MNAIGEIIKTSYALAYTSDFIPVGEEQVVYINGFGKSRPHKERIALYDELYQFVGFSQVSGDASNYDKYTATVSGGYYFRITIELRSALYSIKDAGVSYNDFLLSPSIGMVDMLLCNAKILNLEEYSKLLQDLRYDIKGMNLISGYEKPGMTVDSTGEIMQGSYLDWTVTKKFCTYRFEELFYNGFGVAGLGGSSKLRSLGSPCFCYDDKGVYIGAVQCETTSGKAKITLLPNTFFVRLSVKVTPATGAASVYNFLNAPTIYIDPDDKNYKHNVEERVSNSERWRENIKIKTSSNINQLKSLENATIDRLTGELIYGGATLEWKCSNLIHLQGNRIIYFNGFGKATIGSPVVCYDSNNNFIGNVDIANSSEKVAINVPSNTHSVRIMGKANGFIDSATVTFNDYADFFDFYYDEIKRSEIETKNKISQDGTVWLQSVTNSGKSIFIPKAQHDLSFEYNNLVSNGEANGEADFYTFTGRKIIVYNKDMFIKKAKTLTYDGFLFRKHNNNRYTLLRQTQDPIVPINGGYFPTELVILDGDLEELSTHRLKNMKSIPDNYPCENHDYVYIDDSHYILLAYKDTIVSNIPDKQGSFKACNCVIQEIKNDAVVFHWESIDHEELYNYGCFNTSWDNFNIQNTQNTVWNDYAHINSICIDKRDGNILASFRHIGVMKIDRTTGGIIWVFGRNHSDITGIDASKCGYLQHHAVYNYDNSITIFDNSGCATDNTRICRYWINENTKALVKFKEYVCPLPRSPFMGSAVLVHENTGSSTFVVNYGGPNTLADKCLFEELTFNNDDTYRRNLRVNYPESKTSKNGMYRVECNPWLVQV